MLSRVKIFHDKPVEVGSYVKYRETVPDRKGFGEVISIIGTGERTRYEIINLNKRLKCVVDSNQRYKRRVISAKSCKHVDISSTLKNKRTFELGDIVHYKFLWKSRFGAVVGFVHPDGLYSSSYEDGYNGTDLITYVEINPKDLTRVRDTDNNIKHYTCTKDRLKVCKVDLWSEKGIVLE
jgi:hypothetical protein